MHEILDRHQLEYELKWELSGKPYLTPRGNLVDAVSAAIKQVTGIDTELSTSGGTSDGRFIADICPQVIEIGPLNATIHKLNECVAVADLDALSEIYRADAGKPVGKTGMSALHNFGDTGDLHTLRDWLRFAVSAFNEAQLSFGHGSASAYDEAAYLILHTLHLPLDTLEPFLDARLTAHERKALHAFSASAWKHECLLPI